VAFLEVTGAEDETIEAVADSIDIGEDNDVLTWTTVDEPIETVV